MSQQATSLSGQTVFSSQTQLQGAPNTPEGWIDDLPMIQAMATQNAACAAQNMLIAATALGLGSCYLMTPTMAFDILKIHNAAKLPVLGAQAICVVVVGYTDDTVPHKPYPETPEEIEYVN